MRISGWSSDWCSSDLWCCRACRAPRAGSALQRRLPRAYRLPMARLLSLLFALMALLLAPPATARERGPVVLAAASLQESLSEAANAWAAERSEEHTSELQSLMRISYAVFCLKKKKNEEKTHR